MRFLRLGVEGLIRKDFVKYRWKSSNRRLTLRVSKDEKGLALCREIVSPLALHFFESCIKYRSYCSIE